MTTPCEAYSVAISELVDGALAPAERARVDSHLDQCAACRGLLADLQSQRRATRGLPRLQPPPALWEAIAHGLRAQGVKDGDKGEGAPGLFARASRTWLGLAAAIVVVVLGAAIALQMRAPADRQVATGQPGNVSAPDLVESVEADLRAAEQHYERAIAGLEKIATAENSTLDPQVAATLKKNLQIIDGAIAESRTALRSEPQSAPARESLFEALRRKMSLLQDTIALMNEMRKGNQAGTAELMDSLQKS
jgi:anti-sigma factor RsiW